VPWIGGHYLIDMIAGAATMLLALAMVKVAPRLWRKIVPPHITEPAPALVA
jgi:membrane-associated phospholipid phosphatase